MGVVSLVAVLSLPYSVLDIRQNLVYNVDIH